MAPKFENSHDKNTLKVIPEPAGDLLDRWQRQMSLFFPERAHLIQRASEHLVCHLRTAQPGKESLRVALLGSGPGLLAHDVLTSLTNAGFDVEMTAIERDPAIVNLGRDAYSPTMNFITLDLATATWSQQLPAQNFDVVLSAYTTHYFHAAALGGFYRNVKSLLAAGGVFVNVDFMSPECQSGAPSQPDADRDGSRIGISRGDGAELTSPSGHIGESSNNNQQEPAPVGTWDELLADIQSHPRYRVDGNPYANAVAGEDGDPALEDHQKLLSAAGLSPVDVLCAEGASMVLVARID